MRQVRVVLLRLVRTLGAALQALSVRITARRQARQASNPLELLSPSALKDLGLSRADILAARADVLDVDTSRRHR